MRIAPFFTFYLVLGACTGPAAPAGQDGASEKNSTPEERRAHRSGSPDPSTVVFYNVENLFDTKNDPGSGDDDFTPGGKLNWTDERYERKLHQLAQAISMAGEELPVMIGLCEVENRKVVVDLSKTPPLDAGDYEVVHQDSPDERGIDVALLVDRKRATVGETVWLMVDLGTDRTRDILHATVDLKGSGPIEVFVNHWPSRREGEKESAPKRMIAAESVRGEVDRLLAMDADARILIMGDLNDEPTDASLKTGLRTLHYLHDPEKHDLYDLVALDETPPKGSISYNGQWQYFDHIIVSAGLVPPLATEPDVRHGAASVKDPRLIFDHPRYGDQPNRTFSGTKYHRDGYSDHLPVAFRLD